MERLAKGQFWEGNSSVGHVKLKLCAKLSDGAAREAVVCGSLKLRRAWTQHRAIVVRI